jgi:hypothetical protein
MTLCGQAVKYGLFGGLVKGFYAELSLELSDLDRNRLSLGEKGNDFTVYLFDLPLTTLQVLWAPFTALATFHLFFPP